MTTTISILFFYFFNVLLNRFINYILYKISDNNPRAVILWFIPVIGTFVLLPVLLMDCITLLLKKINLKINKTPINDWFCGKNW